MKAGNTYLAYGLSIESEVELPGLPRSSVTPDIRIRYGIVPELPAPPAYFLSGDGEGLYSSRAAGFLISNGRDITIMPRAASNPELLRVILLGRVMSIALRQRGWLPMHASGIKVGAEAVVLAGKSGAGKSTMAAAMHAAGHRFLADDVVAVRYSGERYLALPGFGRVRLKHPPGDAATWGGLPDADKVSIDLSGGSALGTSLAVRAIFVLEFGPELALRRCAALEGAFLLDQHTVLRRFMKSKSELMKQLAESTRLATILPVYRLTRPANRDLFHQVRELIEGVCK